MAREPHRSSEILDAVALLVIDMQDAFLRVMPDADSVLRRTALAIESARAIGIKVIFTEQVPQKLGPTNPNLRALAPDARVFAKNTFSGLQAEGIQDYLRKINVYHLLLAGIETPICVYQTALHAHDSEFDVTVLSDCTTGRRSDDCLVILEALARADCSALPAETVFYSMLGSSAHAAFGRFTEIVKRYDTDAPFEEIPAAAPIEPPARPERPERPERHERPAREEHRRHRHADAEVAGEKSEPEDETPEAEEPESDFEQRADDSSSEAPDSSADATGTDEADTDAGPSEENQDDESALRAAPAAKKRPRRRRGGVRHRKARDRARATAGGAAAEAGASDSNAPAESPVGDETSESDREPTVE